MGEAGAGPGGARGGARAVTGGTAKVCQTRPGWKKYMITLTAMDGPHRWVVVVGAPIALSLAAGCVGAGAARGAGCRAVFASKRSSRGGGQNCESST